MEGFDGGGTGAVMRGLKKGPWTAAEDAILMEYVRKHGEGNWNAVQKNSGLLRCGKSCRLRWANHLRPNLKKGSFSREEEKIIIDLHAKMGNRWARMAAQLPGRTDNEIKNYWNTRMKRRQRAGLPLYPHEAQEEITSFHFQPQNQYHHYKRKHMSSHSPSSSSSSSFSSSSSPYDHPPKRVRLNPFPNPSFNPILADSSLNFQFSSLYNNLDGLSATLPYNETPRNNNYYYYNNGCFGFSLPLSSSSSSSNYLYKQNHLLEFVSGNLETKNNSNSSGNNNVNGRNIDLMSYSALLMGEEIEPVPFTAGLDNILELPSNQTLTNHSLTTNTILNENELLPVAASNSGLLDALLEESQALCRSGGSKEIRACSNLDDSKKKADECMVGKDLLNDLSSTDHQSSIGLTNTNKNHKEPTTMMDAMIMNYSPSSMVEDDDDLLISLLKNFPASSTPLMPDDWCRLRTQNQAVGINGDDLDPSTATPASTILC